MIRPVSPQEYDQVAELCIDAYVSAGTITTDDPYVPFLLDTHGRVSVPGAEVLVLGDAGELVGTVTMCPHGSALTEVCLPGEVEPRVLAVAPAHARKGFAGALIEASENWAREHGYRVVTVCVASHNEVGHHLYRKHGFTRRPERDWVTDTGVLLQTYTKDVPVQGATYCGRCGVELDAKDHAECRAALDLEPPRYCEVCKRRMIVQVTPAGWSARCKEHGELSASTQS